MRHVDVLLKTPAATELGSLADAGTVRTYIRDEVCSLVTRAVVGLRARNRVSSEVQDVTAPRRRTPRGKLETSPNMERLRSLGVLDDSDRDEAGGPSPHLSPEEESKNIVDGWLLPKR